VLYRALLVLVVVGFGALTGLALRDHGVWGIIAPHFKTFGGAQVFTDLVIALSLAMIWIWHDAGERRVAAWPWILLTLATGSFGPLLYLLVRLSRGAQSAARSERVLRANAV
jgi:hypothetical protein